MSGTEIKQPADDLAIGAIGVVFGDIGTSPLYALRECFSPVHGVAVERENILGVVSLLIWTLSLIVCVKYLIIVLRADNKGEGGILALVSLVSRYVPQGSKRRAGFWRRSEYSAPPSCTATA